MDKGTVRLFLIQRKPAGKSSLCIVCVVSLMYNPCCDASVTDQSNPEAVREF